MRRRPGRTGDLGLRLPCIHSRHGLLRPHAGARTSRPRGLWSRLRDRPSSTASSRRPMHDSDRGHRRHGYLVGRRLDSHCTRLPRHRPDRGVLVDTEDRCRRPTTVGFTVRQVRTEALIRILQRALRFGAKCGSTLPLAHRSAVVFEPTGHSVPWEDLRRRDRHRCQDSRPYRRSRPVRERGGVRELQRHRTDRGRQCRQPTASIVAVRRPHTELCDPHSRCYPGANTEQRRIRLPPAQDG